METINKVHRSSLFLLELMITILLFSVNCGVCIQVFGQAYQESRQAQALTCAVGECSDVAELIRASRTPSQAEQAVKSAYPCHEIRDGNITLLLENGDRIILKNEPVSEVYRAAIEYQASDCTPVYTLNIAKYFQEVGT